jgi:hypothetical protein
MYVLGLLCSNYQFFSAVSSLELLLDVMFAHNSCCYALPKPLQIKETEGCKTSSKFNGVQL